MKRFVLFAFLSLAAAASMAAAPEFTLTIENHVFAPKEVKIPAGQKVIPGKTTATIHIGPLKPGRYPFVEEYHETEAGAQGTIVVE